MTSGITRPVVSVPIPQVIRLGTERCAVTNFVLFTTDLTAHEGTRLVAVLEALGSYSGPQQTPAAVRGCPAPTAAARAPHDPL
jgi:hypothetical protein